MAYGSNYPPTWASSSGPPPPPAFGMGFGMGGSYDAMNIGMTMPGASMSFGMGGPQGMSFSMGGFGGNPYGMNMHGGNPYQTGSAPPPSAGYGGFGGGYSYGGGAGGGAVPGFTAPTGPPQGMTMPSSMQYANAQHAFQPYGVQTQMLQEIAYNDIHNQTQVQEITRLRKELEDEKQKKSSSNNEAKIDDSQMEKLQKMMELQQKMLADAQAKVTKDDGMKETMKQKFVDELMRRQALNGTFEDTHGTVFAFVTYGAEDPVCQWFQTKKQQDIKGEKWDPLYDSEYLRYGIKGLGTNEQVIIDVTSTRCNAQRYRIRTEYKTAYGRDLIQDLKSELSGDFKESILACYESQARYDAWCVKNAIYGLGTDEATLIEILMTRTNDQINLMKKEYNNITYEKQRDPGSSIEKDIEDDCSGDFKRLLISACQGNRRLVERDRLVAAVEEIQNHQKEWTGMFRINYDKLSDKQKCKRMAEELFKAGEARWGTDEETFNRIFSVQDFYTLRSVWQEYVAISQRDIMNSVDRETSGDLKNALLTIAQCIKCRPMCFAERLYKSMKGLGTDDSTLIRICISRSEMDMVQIKACFLEMYKQTLWNFIKDDTSGDYRKLLCAIVGKN